jgi:hypothetical protein
MKVAGERIKPNVSKMTHHAQCGMLKDDSMMPRCEAPIGKWAVDDYR